MARPQPLPAREQDVVKFAARGPYAVGITTMHWAHPDSPGRRLATDIWYPAEAGSEGPPANHPLNLPHDAIESAPVAPGSFPLVAFSHGNSGIRRQSTFLTTHLASWGIVVAAPDHPGNTFFEMAQLETDAQRKQVHLDARHHRPIDLSVVIDRVAAGSDAWPAVDRARVGCMGHSFGGWTALKMPRRDSRIRAVCGLAPASEPFVGRKAFEPDELPFEGELPVLIVAGIDDVLVDLETSVRPLFERISDPRALIAVDQVDHINFSDGVELLHGMHASNVRPNQPRPTKPYSQQLPEHRIHRLLNALVTHFFNEALVSQRSAPTEHLTPGALEAVDPALVRLDPTA
jgi:predicted dienelactone hydrolase